MQTVYGPEAQNGDYVLVLDVNYMARSGATYLAKVHNGKAYTGKRIPTTNGIRYIHKKVAQVVVPADIVPEETKREIEYNIDIHN